MLEKFLHFWQLKDLRTKVITTILLLIVVRVLIFVPLPLIKTSSLQQLFDQNAFLGFLNIFSGGGLQNFSIITMGVSPYITASIIIQLLTVIVPSLDELQKEGDYGQRKINQYTRLLTLPLGIIQGYGTLLLLKQNSIITSWTPLTLIATLLMMTAGSLFVMWLGEIITESGVGNGMSLIITLGILGAIPLRIQSLLAGTASTGQTTKLLTLVLITLVSIVFVIIINEAKRLVPVTYARKARYNSGAFGSVDSYLPIKINTAGVIPIIFAIALLTMPAFVGQFLSHAKTAWLANLAVHINNIFQPTTITYQAIYFLLVFIFTYFYTYIVFKPEQVAENLQKQGGFIPGVRPGTETANFVRTILNRITLLGALFLAIIAIFPALLQHQYPSSSLLLTGTSLLIVVSVILETGRQIESQYLMRTYDAYSQY